MTTDELRAKFEAWFDREFRYVNMSIVRGVASAERCSKEMAWAGYQAAHASRDAEVEALRKDAERYRWLRDVGDATWTPLHDRMPNYDIDYAIDAAMRDGSDFPHPNCCQNDNTGG